MEDSPLEEPPLTFLRLGEDNLRAILCHAAESDRLPLLLTCRELQSVAANCAAESIPQ